MANVSFRIEDELKERMERTRQVNWSEVVRRAIAERLEFEEKFGKEKIVDSTRISNAIKGIERLRNKTSGKWSGADEIRKWRDQRK